MLSRAGKLLEQHARVVLDAVGHAEFEINALSVAPAERVVVGLPLTLGGARGEQAAETERFVDVLRGAVDVPVELFDERFTTNLAQQTAGTAPEDALAAAHLLSSYLEWCAARS